MSAESELKHVRLLLEEIAEGPADCHNPRGERCVDYAEKALTIVRRISPALASLEAERDALRALVNDLRNGLLELDETLRKEQALSAAEPKGE
jgi:hypothetical protein